MIADLEALALEYVPLTRLLSEGMVTRKRLVDTVTTAFPEIPPDLSEITLDTGEITPVKAEAIIALLLLDKFPRHMLRNDVMNIFRDVPESARLTVYPHLFNLIEDDDADYWNDTSGFYSCIYNIERGHRGYAGLKLLHEYMRKYEVPLRDAFVPVEVLTFPPDFQDLVFTELQVMVVDATEAIANNEFAEVIFNRLFDQGHILPQHVLDDIKYRNEASELPYLIDAVFNSGNPAFIATLKARFHELTYMDIDEDMFVRLRQCITEFEAE